MVILPEPVFPLSDGQLQGRQEDTLKTTAPKKLSWRQPDGSDCVLTINSRFTYKCHKEILKQSSYLQRLLEKSEDVTLEQYFRFSNFLR